MSDGSMSDGSERIRELERLNAVLDEQVKQLVRIEQRLYLSQRDLARQLARVDALNRFAIDIAGLESPTEIVSRAADVLFAIFPLDQYVGFLADDQARLWPAAVRAAPGREPRDGADRAREPIRVALPAEIVVERAADATAARPELAPLLARVDAIFGGERAAGAHVVVIPIARGGRVAAVMVFRHGGGAISFHEELPTPRDVTFLAVYAQGVAAALTNARLVERERLAAVGELAAVVAHEVRNPLGAIFNSLSLLDRHVAGRPGEESLLGIVREEAERLNQLVSDLIEFARPQSPAPREESLFAIAESALAGVRARFPGVTFELGADEGAGPAWADARMVRQAIANLLVNAAQATGEPPHVEVRVGRAAPGRVRIAVIDRGPGIPDGLEARIFEPFFTTKASGTGLGLAVAKRFVDAHGGEIVASRTPGGGTTFTLSLPAAPR